MIKIVRLVKFATAAFFLLGGIDESYSSSPSQELQDHPVISVKAEMEDLVEHDEYKPHIAYQPLPRGKNQPWRLIRELQHAQDAIVSGNPRSLDEYRMMLVNYSRILLRQGDEVWANERNLYAAAVYVMIGGNPAVGIKAAGASSLDNSNKVPLNAAVAYAERRFDVARRLMKEIDHKLLPAFSSAQFALAKSMVYSSINLKLAGFYLDEARRLAPGTLIEEASLRRGLRIAGEKHDLAKFRYLTATYINNFGQSLYFGDFLRIFALELTRMPEETKGDLLAHLKGVLDMLNERQQLILVTYVAANATIKGKLGIASFSSKFALGRLKKGSKLHTRMSLYYSASGIVQHSLLRDALNQMKTVNRVKLDTNDQVLYDAVKIVAAQLDGGHASYAQLKKVLLEEQQTYPGDIAPVPDLLEESEATPGSNKILQRSEELFIKYDEAMLESGK